jgi:hypothetical protein
VSQNQWNLAFFVHFFFSHPTQTFGWTFFFWNFKIFLVLVDLDSLLFMVPKDLTIWSLRWLFWVSFGISIILGNCSLLYLEWWELSTFATNWGHISCL